MRSINLVWLQNNTEKYNKWKAFTLIYKLNFQLYKSECEYTNKSNPSATTNNRKKNCFLNKFSNETQNEINKVSKWCVTFTFGSVLRRKQKKKYWTEELNGKMKWKKKKDFVIILKVCVRSLYIWKKSKSFNFISSNRRSFSHERNE